MDSNHLAVQRPEDWKHPLQSIPNNLPDGILRSGNARESTFFVEDMGNFKLVTEGHDGDDHRPSRPSIQTTFEAGLGIRKLSPTSVSGWSQVSTTDINGLSRVGTPNSSATSRASTPDVHPTWRTPYLAPSPDASAHSRTKKPSPLSVIPTSYLDDGDLSGVLPGSNMVPSVAYANAPIVLSAPGWGRSSAQVLSPAPPSKAARVGGPASDLGIGGGGGGELGRYDILAGGRKRKRTQSQGKAPANRAKRAAPVQTEDAPTEAGVERDELIKAKAPTKKTASKHSQSLLPDALGVELWRDDLKQVLDKPVVSDTALDTKSLSAEPVQTSPPVLDPRQDDSAPEAPPIWYQNGEDDLPLTLAILAILQDQATQTLQQPSEEDLLPLGPEVAHVVDGLLPLAVAETGVHTTSLPVFGDLTQGTSSIAPNNDINLLEDLLGSNFAFEDFLHYNPWTLDEPVDFTQNYSSEGAGLVSAPHQPLPEQQNSDKFSGQGSAVGEVAKEGSAKEQAHVPSTADRVDVKAPIASESNSGTFENSTVPSKLNAMPGVRKLLPKAPEEGTSSDITPDTSIARMSGDDVALFDEAETVKGQKGSAKVKEPKRLRLDANMKEFNVEDARFLEEYPAYQIWIVKGIAAKWLTKVRGNVTRNCDQCKDKRERKGSSGEKSLGCQLRDGIVRPEDVITQEHAKYQEYQREDHRCYQCFTNGYDCTWTKPNGKRGH